MFFYRIKEKNSWTYYFYGLIFHKTSAYNMLWKRPFHLSFTSILIKLGGCTTAFRSFTLDNRSSLVAIDYGFFKDMFVKFMEEWT